MSWLNHSTCELEYDSFIYKGIEYLINKRNNSPLDEFMRIFEYSCFVGFKAVFSFRFNKLFLKDLFDGTKSIKNSISDKKCKWYNGVLSGENGNNYMVLQIENRKIIKKKLMDIEECHHFYNKWIENIMSSDDYSLLLNKYSDFAKKHGSEEKGFDCYPLCDLYESEEDKNKRHVEEYFIHWYYNICKNYLPEYILK